jgi:hypothetical protein
MLIHWKYLCSRAYFHAKCFCATPTHSLGRKQPLHFGIKRCFLREFLASLSVGRQMPKASFLTRLPAYPEAARAKYTKEPRRNSAAPRRKPKEAKQPNATRHILEKTDPIYVDQRRFLH